MSLPRLSTRAFCCHIIAILFLLAGRALAQTTINVPADQPTIQGAINAASNGDTVLVAPGTYIENLNFNGKAITVTSSGGPAVTIVDGNAAGPVVIFNTNEDANSVLNGFTLQNGLAPFSWPMWGSGGGIFIYYVSPTITNNVITGNHANGGLGIEIEGGAAVIRGNTITGNTWGGDVCCGGGGGIEVLGGAPQIIGNTITNNSPAGSGGGIEVNGGSPTIQNNYIAGNSAYNPGGAINIVNGGSSVIAQNIIVNNSVGGGGSGAGISMQTPADETALIINNTIVGNTAFDKSSGLFLEVLGSVTVSNNIVMAAPGQNAIVCTSYSSILPHFSHNDGFSPGSGGQGWSSDCANFAQIDGNISADPQFVNAASGNYRLQADSPAIDAGDNGVPNLPQQDYAGNPRVLDGNNDCVSAVDLGVYEFSAIPSSVSFPFSYLSFPSQVVGTSSNPLIVTLTNTGGSCFQFPGTQITGDFSQTNTCPAAGLPGGRSCAYSVAFTPTASGTRTGALTVPGSDGVTRSAPSVSLNGTGLTPPAVSLSSTSLNFGSVPLGSNGAQTITLTNTGQGSLNIYSVSTASPFSANNSCPATLAGGGSCSITVVFVPVNAGLQSGLLSISDNAAGSPHTVNLSGTGTDFSVSASPAGGTIRAGQSIQFTINVAPVAGPYNPGVTLSCSGPGYAPCTFSPPSLIPGASGANSVLTISTNKTLSKGTYTIGVIGQSGSLQHSTTISLTVK